MSSKILITRKYNEPLKFHLINYEIDKYEPGATKLIIDMLSEDCVEKLLVDKLEFLRLHEDVLNFLNPPNTNAIFKDINAFMITVCDVFKTNIDKLKTKTRKREVVKSRQLIYYILRREGYGSLANVAYLFRQDHATVLHACKTVDNHIEVRDLYFYPKLIAITDMYNLTAKYKLKP